MIVDIIYNIPTWLLGICILTIIALISLCGLLVMRTIMKKNSIQMDNSIVGGIGDQATVIFAVVAGFIAISVWTNFDKASERVQEEADQAFAIWLDSRIYPLDFKLKVRNAIEEYLHIVIDEEWPKQSQGESSNAAVQTLENLNYLLIDYVPTSASQQAIHNQIILRSNKIFYDRRSRLHILTLDPAVYYAIICNILVILGLAWCFAAKNLRSHLIVTTLFSLGIGLVLFLIITFDHPFRGEVSIPPKPFQEALQHIQELKLDDPVILKNPNAVFRS